MRDILHLNPTDEQAAILLDLAKYGRLSVKSGHSVGKSCVAGCAALWFLYTHVPSKVITTAPTERQVKEILWREIRFRHALSGVLKPKPLKLMLDISPEHFAIGISTNDEQQMQGFHSPNIMVIIDEANGYVEEMYGPIESLLSGGEVIKFLQIGNPLVPTGTFHNSFTDGITKCHTISCLNHPNIKQGRNVIPGAVTVDWIEKMRRLWGEDSGFWQSRVLGQFPKVATDVVIQLAWIEAAEERVDKRKYKNTDLYLGYDSAEYGDDEHFWFRGTQRKKVEKVTRRGIEPAAGINMTKLLINKYKIPQNHVTIDGIGAGATAYSVLKQDFPKIRRFVASVSAIDTETFEDLQTESYWNIRNMVNPESEKYTEYAFGMQDDRLKADLCSRKYEASRTGRYMLEPKKIFRKRMRRSPDHGDAFVICYSPLVGGKSYGGVALGDVIGGY